MFDDSKEAIRTARSILRSKLLKLATQVDDNKHPQVEITEGLKELSILNDLSLHFNTVFSVYTKKET